MLDMDVSIYEDSQSFILGILDPLDACVTGDGAPNRYSVVRNGSPYCLVCHQLCLFLLSPVCSRKGLQDIVPLADSSCYLAAVDVEAEGSVQVDPSTFGLRLRGSVESAILIFGWSLAWCGSGVKRVIDDFGADIRSEFAARKTDISVTYS